MRRTSKPRGRDQRVQAVARRPAGAARAVLEEGREEVVGQPARQRVGLPGRERDPLAQVVERDVSDTRRRRAPRARRGRASASRAKPSLREDALDQTHAADLVQRQPLGLGVGELLGDPSVHHVEDVEPAPAAHAPLALDRAQPADQGLARDRIDEEVLAREADLPEDARELRRERRADRGRAAALLPVELVVHGVVGEEAHHPVQVVAVEGIRETNHEVFEFSVGHHCAPGCARATDCISLRRWSRCSPCAPRRPPSGG